MAQIWNSAGTQWGEGVQKERVEKYGSFSDHGFHDVILDLGY